MAGIDPSVTDERDAFSVDAALDPFDADVLDHERLERLDRPHEQSSDQGHRRRQFFLHPLTLDQIRDTSLNSAIAINVINSAKPICWPISIARSESGRPRTASSE